MLLLQTFQKAIASADFRSVAATAVAVVAGGAVFFHLQEEHGWSTLRVRMTAQCIAFIGAGAGLIICAFLRNAAAAFSFMVLAQVRQLPAFTQCRALR